MMPDVASEGSPPSHAGVDTRVNLRDRLRRRWLQLSLLVPILLILAACHECNSDDAPSNQNTEEIIFHNFFDPVASTSLATPSLTPSFEAAATGDFFTAKYDFLPRDTSLTVTPTLTSTAILEQLAGSGFVAIRVPHAPPTYTVGSISAVAASFYHQDPATRRTLESPIPLTRRSDLVARVEARFPITDGRSHWEAWGLPPGERFPFPTESFRNPQFRANVTFSYPGVGFAPCAGCTIEVVLSNGGLFLGPYPQTVEYQGAGGASQEAGLAQFAACGFQAPESLALEISPGRPFTVNHCLHNRDAVTHTFGLEMSSAQNWPYTYLLQPYTYLLRGGDPDAVQPLTSTQVTLPGRDVFPTNRIGILAVYTPTTAISATVQETFAITATSTLSPTQVRANAQTFIFGPEFDVLAGAEAPDRRVYLPFVLRNR